MAAKDLLCDLKDGKVNAGNIGLAAIKVDTEDPIKDIKTEAQIIKMCKEVKWVGPPDKEDDLTDKQGSWGRDPCVGDMPAMMSVMPFIWYFVFYLGLLSYLIFNIWSLKEELAGAPAADTEMGKKPAVAVATATATAAAWAPARLLTRRWPGKASHWCHTATVRSRHERSGHT